MESSLVTHRTLTYRFIVAALAAGYFFVFRPRVTGRDHVPATGGILIAANHQSALDIPLIAWAAGPRHVAFVARHTLARRRWLAWVMRKTGTVLIERGKSDRAALRAMCGHLDADDAIAIFPEGTRTRDGRLAPFKKGALLAARLSKVPIVPCAIRGSYQAWPVGRRFPRPGRLEIEFGAPIDPGADDALGLTRGSVARMLGEVAEPALSPGTEA